MRAAIASYISRRGCLSLLLAAVATATAGALPAGGRALSGASSCRLFPPSNHWNQRIDHLPVARSSAALVRSIGLDAGLHADFGSGTYEGRPIGIPFKTVSRRQRKVRVSFAYADESDRARYPIPRKVPIEGGPDSTGDRHVILVDRDRCRLYEL